MSEKAPHRIESKEKTTKPEEELLAHFRSTCETESGAALTHEAKVTTYHSLHDDLDQLEDAPMIGQYEKAMIPTIHSLTEASRIASAALEAQTDDEEAVRIGKLIRGQVGGIRTWSRRYVSTIIKFHTAKRRLVLMNDVERRNALEQADAERRRVHDSLLTCLRTFTALLKEGAEYAAYTAPLAWSPGILLPEGTASEKAVIFSDSALTDRDLIKSWAIASDCVEEMRSIIGSEDFPPE